MPLHRRTEDPYWNPPEEFPLPPAPLTEAEQLAPQDIIIDARSGRVRQAGAHDAEGSTILQLKAKAEEKLFVFAKFILGRKRLTPTLHGQLCRRIQQIPPRRKLFLLPMGTFKTTLISQALPMHMHIQAAATNPYWPGLDGSEMRIMLGCEAQDLASSRLRWVASQWETNKLLRAFWPHKCWDRPLAQAPKWNETEIILPRAVDYPEPSMHALGVGGAFIGYHYNCLASGSLVYTSNGLFPIEEVRVGMRVLTHTGHHSEVVAVASQPSSRQLLGVRMWGQPELLRCTDDHRVLCYREHRLDWCAAQDLKLGDYLALPIPQGRTRAISRINPRIDRLINIAAIWRLLGYWLAEGAASHATNQVRLTFGAHEEGLVRDAMTIVEKYLGCPVHRSLSASSTAVVSFSDADFKTLTRKFGTHAWNKIIPPLALASKRHFRAELVRGYFLGDGHQKSCGWQAVSVSRSLIAGMQLLLASLEIPSVVRVGSAAKQGVLIVGNLCNARASYVVESAHPLMDVLMGTPATWPRIPCRTVLIPGFLLSPIREIRDLGEAGIVHDLQIAADESFTVPGVCVHNCLLKDDIVALKAANSPIVMDGAYDWHLASRTRLSPDEELGLEFTVGTRWAPRDVYERMMEEDPTVEVETHALIEDGLPLFPESFPLEKIAQLQKEEGVMFWLWRMNSTANPELVDFDLSQLRSYELKDNFLLFSEDDRDLDLAKAPKPKAMENNLAPKVMTRDAWDDLIQELRADGVGVKARMG